MKQIRSLHWALRLVILILATGLSFLGLNVVLSAGTSSLDEVRGFQTSWLVMVFLGTFYGFILFGTNVKPKKR